MGMTLDISHDLSLPAEAMTKTFVTLAKRAAGNTCTEVVMVEVMLKGRVPCGGQHRRTDYDSLDSEHAYRR